MPKPLLILALAFILLIPQLAYSEGNLIFDSNQATMLIKKARKDAKAGNYQAVIKNLEPLYAQQVKTGKGPLTSEDQKIFDDLWKTLAWGYTGTGEKLIRQKQYDKGIQYCNQALKTFENIALAYSWIGVALSNQGNLEEGLKFGLLAEKNFDNVSDIERSSIIFTHQKARYIKMASKFKKEGNKNGVTLMYKGAIEANNNYLNVDPNGKFSRSARKSNEILKRELLNDPNFK